MTMTGTVAQPSDRFSLRDRRVLYTGAAGGLGNDTTREMLRDGAYVIALDNSRDNIRSLEANCGSEYRDRLRIVRQDLADEASLKQTLASLLDEGSFDIVINNAAIYPSKPFEDYTLEEHRAVQAVNVDAALICTAMALPAMRARKWGRIINVTSITYYGGWENLSPYVQSKGALTGLTRAWAREFGKWGITVNAISPGAFPTDAEKIHPNPEEYARFVLEHQAVKRRGIASDIASAICFLASDEAGFVTGQTINVDGGWVMK
ncbi:MAG: SDR family oxidoreductase [Alphaproteobacteria bacterium]|nr:SDR family oxidoreductase [Alphaproteobacteria bacterium]